MRKLFCLQIESGDSIKPVAIIEADSESSALIIARAKGLCTDAQIDSEKAMAPQITASQAMQAPWIKTRLYKAA